MEQHTAIAIDSIWHLTAAILSDCQQVLAPHHIPGIGMGEVEAANDLELWLDDSFMDDGEGGSVDDELMDADAWHGGGGEKKKDMYTIFLNRRACCEWNKEKKLREETEIRKLR